MIEIFDRHDQTQACRNLLATVIQLAVADACSQPPKRREGDNAVLSHITVDALTALRFMFDESVSGLNEYATWLDFDPGQFRRKLQDTMYNDSPLTINGFESNQRRNFRYNYTTWRRFANQITEADLGEHDD